jgi:hypothetical protein
MSHSRPRCTTSPFRGPEFSHGSSPHRRQVRAPCTKARRSPRDAVHAAQTPTPRSQTPSPGDSPALHVPFPFLPFTTLCFSVGGGPGWAAIRRLLSLQYTTPARPPHSLRVTQPTSRRTAFPRGKQVDRPTTPSADRLRAPTSRPTAPPPPFLLPATKIQNRPCPPIPTSVAVPRFRTFSHPASRAAKTKNRRAPALTAVHQTGCITRPNPRKEESDEGAGPASRPTKKARWPRRARCRREDRWRALGEARGRRDVLRGVRGRGKAVNWQRGGSGCGAGRNAPVSGSARGQRENSTMAERSRKLKSYAALHECVVRTYRAKPLDFSFCPGHSCHYARQ